MMENGNSRITMEGLLSFVKGCSRFKFGGSTNTISLTKWKLKQRSENPIVYTKISCHISWIASQYNMTVRSSNFGNDQEVDCIKGTGNTGEYDYINEENNPEDTNVKGCTNVYPFTLFDLQISGHPSATFDEMEPTEVNCIFPFILNGTRFDTCSLYDVEELGKGSCKCEVINLDKCIQYLSIGDAYQNSAFSVSSLHVPNSYHKGAVQ